jgi:hypothetical protein
LKLQESSRSVVTALMRRRFGYRLTEKGFGLAPVLVAVVIWSARCESTDWCGAPMAPVGAGWSTIQPMLGSAPARVPLGPRVTWRRARWSPARAEQCHAGRIHDHQRQVLTPNVIGHVQEVPVGSTFAGTFSRHSKPVSSTVRRTPSSA